MLEVAAWQAGVARVRRGWERQLPSCMRSPAHRTTRRSPTPAPPLCRAAPRPLHFWWYRRRRLTYPCTFVAAADQTLAPPPPRPQERREERLREEIEKFRRENPKISEQFADLKRRLSELTGADWEAIPDIGDYTVKKRKAEVGGWLRWNVLGGWVGGWEGQ